MAYVSLILALQYESHTKVDKTRRLYWSILNSSLNHIKPDQVQFYINTVLFCLRTTVFSTFTVRKKRKMQTKSNIRSKSCCKVVNYILQKSILKPIFFLLKNCLSCFSEDLIMQTPNVKQSSFFLYYRQLALCPSTLTKPCNLEYLWSCSYFRKWSRGRCVCIQHRLPLGDVLLAGVVQLSGDIRLGRLLLLSQFEHSFFHQSSFSQNTSALYMS